MYTKNRQNYLLIYFMFLLIYKNKQNTIYEFIYFCLFFQYICILIVLICIVCKEGMYLSITNLLTGNVIICLKEDLYD